MNYIISAAILSLPSLFFTFFLPVGAHMSVVSPCPRASSICNSGYGSVNYDIESPYPRMGKSSFPCREKKRGESVATYASGGKVNFVIKGQEKYTTNHDGGDCQFAVSYDNERFVVLRDVLRNCLSGRGNGPYSYTVPLPRGMPAGNVVPAWVWYPREGNKDLYMSCIDVIINKGPKRGEVIGKELMVARVQGAPDLAEWKYTHEKDGLELYARRNLIAMNERGQLRTIARGGNKTKAWGNPQEKKGRERRRKRTEEEEEEEEEEDDDDNNDNNASQE